MAGVKDLDHALVVLELPNGSTRKEIIQKYRELAKKYHPDFFHSEDIPDEVRDHATEKIKIINEAYRVALASVPSLDESDNSSTGVEIAWKFNTNYQVFGPPVIVNEVLYFCTRGPIFANRDGSLFAVDLTTGREIWRFRTTGEATRSVSISDGVAYFGAGDGSLYAVDVNTPAEIWRVKAQNPILSTPVVADGTLFTQHFSDNALTALDIKTGKLKWMFQTAGQVYYNPAVINNTAYFFTAAKYVYSVDIKTGEMKWRIKLSSDFPSFEPVIYKDLFLFYSLDTSITAFDMESGRERWRQHAGYVDGNVTEGISIGDGMVFAASQSIEYTKDQDLRRLMALDAASGQPIWQSVTNSERFYTPVYHDGIVYTSSLNGAVAAFDAKSGERRWDFNFENWTYRLAAHGGNIYIGSWDCVYALKPTRTQPIKTTKTDVRKKQERMKRIQAK